MGVCMIGKTSPPQHPQALFPDPLGGVKHPSKSPQRPWLLPTTLRPVIIKSSYRPLSIWLKSKIVLSKALILIDPWLRTITACMPVANGACFASSKIVKLVSTLSVLLSLVWVKIASQDRIQLVLVQHVASRVIIIIKWLLMYPTI